MRDMQPRFMDPADHRPEEPGQWPAVTVPGERIAEEADRLGALPAPDDGRRESLIVTRGH